MCCCASPNINGHHGYQWQPKDTPGIRPANPPPMQPGDDLIFDEPGRCGGLDCHSHHFRVVKRGGVALLLWNHGGGPGDARLPVGQMVLPALLKLDSHARYFVLHSMFDLHRDAGHFARNAEMKRWHDAAVEKRIKLSRRKGAIVSARILEPWEAGQ